MSALPQANPAVVYRPLPDGGVLFSPADEIYFGLNTTGACIWENLAPVKSSIEEVCAEIGSRFPGAEPAKVRNDVEQMISAFVENGLAISA
ncbi:MAG TPA: PqqD family protein [Gemmatimonadaceae bacterium]